jgi:hypothetical protein
VSNVAVLAVTDSDLSLLEILPIKFIRTIEGIERTNATLEGVISKGIHLYFFPGTSIFPAQEGRHGK